MNKKFVVICLIIGVLGVTLLMGANYLHHGSILAVPIEASASSNMEDSRYRHAMQAKHHMQAAKIYRDNSFHMDIIDSGAEDQYMRKAIYHSTMASNYLKLLDLRSSQKHSIGMDDML